jgi:hypothetical protein
MTVNVLNAHSALHWADSLKCLQLFGKIQYVAVQRSACFGLGPCHAFHQDTIATQSTERDISRHWEDAAIIVQHTVRVLHSDVEYSQQDCHIHRSSAFSTWYRPFAADFTAFLFLVPVNFVSTAVRPDSCRDPRTILDRHNGVRSGIKLDRCRWTQLGEDQ